MTEDDLGRMSKREIDAALNHPPDWLGKWERRLQTPYPKYTRIHADELRHLVRIARAGVREGYANCPCESCTALRDAGLLREEDSGS